MDFWIDIENATGTKYGSGPITSATDWEVRPRLDAAGTFSFHMPAADPQSTIVQNKRIAHCYGILDGAVTDLGMGIIEKIEVQPGDPTMLTVSGPDILAELAYPSVGDLLVREQQWTHLDDPTFGTIHWIQYRSEFGWYWDGNYGGVLNDDNTGTYATVTIHASRVGYPEDAQYLYIGCDSRYSAIRFTFEALNTASDADDALRIQYPCEAGGWKLLTGWTDNTNDGNGPWRVADPGTVTFTPPDDWVRYDEAVGDAGNWYWLRIRAADNGPDNPRYISADIQEVEVYADFPTKTGPELVMDFAPVTWAISWASDPDPVETVYDKYLQYQGESVLTALLMLTEQGGQDTGTAIREHFRLGSGRTVEWLGTTQTETGLRAVAATDSADETVLITDLTRIEDTSEVVTRLYAWSGDGIGLETVTDSPPTGYTIGSTTFETVARYYVEHDAGVAAYGAIERWVQFSELSQQQTNTLSTHNAYTANAVLSRAAEYLRTHAVKAEHYALRVAAFTSLISVGETIECVYYEYRNGEQVVAIDTYADNTPLWIISRTLQVTSEGIAIIGLEVATVDRDAKSDAGVVVDLVRERQRTSGNVNNLIGGSAGSVPVVLTAGADIRVSGYEIQRAGSGILLFSGSGALLAEYATITTALAAASSGDIVEIPAGTLTENVTIPAGVTLRGRGWASIINGYVIVGVGSMLDNCKVYQSVNSSSDIIGVIGPDAAGTGYVRDVFVELIQAGSGKALGTLARGGAGAYLEWKGNYRIRCSGGTGSRWAYASADDSAVVLNHGNVKAWIGA